MTDIDLAAIRERYDAWKRISDAGNDDLGEGTVAMVLAGNDVPALLAAVERLTAERDQVACERDGVREELARMAGDLDDARSERDSNRAALRVVAERMGAVGAERYAMRPVVEAAVAWREANQANLSFVDLYRAKDAVFAAVDAYTAQEPGVDTGTSEPRTAGSGEAGPADGAVVAEPRKLMNTTVSRTPSRDTVALNPDDDTDAPDAPGWKCCENHG